MSSPLPQAQLRFDPDLGRRLAAYPMRSGGPKSPDDDTKQRGKEAVLASPSRVVMPVEGQVNVPRRSFESEDLSADYYARERRHRLVQSTDDGMQNSAPFTVSRRSAPNWFATKSPITGACFACAGTIGVPLSPAVVGPQPVCAISFEARFT